MSPKSRREDVIDAAARLFYRKGIRSVGVDTIAESAGVSKMTLYNHFPSKDDLAAAYLRRRDESVHRFIEARVVELGSEPRDRPLAMFDAFAEQLERDNYRGCHLINALAEFPDEVHLIRHTAIDLNDDWRAYITQLLHAADFPRPEMLAEQLFLLLEGAFVTAAMEGKPNSMDRARQVAFILLNQASGAGAVQQSPASGQTSGAGS
jgi:AcrR family transcriptional regulator